mgnify:CR=1 FL=1
MAGMHSSTCLLVFRGHRIKEYSFFQDSLPVNEGAISVQDLQRKYQQLVEDYAKVKTQNAVLKKAVLQVCSALILSHFYPQELNCLHDIGTREE